MAEDIHYVTLNPLERMIVYRALSYVALRMDVQSKSVNSDTEQRLGCTITSEAIYSVLPKFEKRPAPKVGK